jgi:hypothetical protein
MSSIPLTASKMTRHQLPVALFEDEQGRGIFEYDKPSSCLFASS